ncbi:MAG TPA: hypothetical protein VGA37_07235 [Gemmatimonadales bacterium]
MRFRRAMKDLLGLEHMMHRPAVANRFWVYCVAAYMMPVVAQIVLPDDPTLYDELVWLVTLAPAFLLSLHYGLKGALVALLMGTALFVAVQLSVAVNYVADDWRITVPIYIAFGTLSMSVGWLSQELHDEYRRLLDGARLAAVNQLSITLRHELNNALQQIVADASILSELGTDLPPQVQESVQAIRDGVIRMTKDIEKLTHLDSAPLARYPGNAMMIDLQRAERHD